MFWQMIVVGVMLSLAEKSTSFKLKLYKKDDGKINISKSLLTNLRKNEKDTNMERHSPKSKRKKKDKGKKRKRKERKETDKLKSWHLHHSSHPHF